jgi:acyl-CoA thioesterase
MGQFETETVVTPTGDGVWMSTPAPDWNIGENANGGYALSAVVRALGAVVGRPDPLSVTTHFLRPLRPDGRPAEIRTALVRAGRSTAIARGTLAHDDRDRLTVLAVFGDLGLPASPAPGSIELAPPDLPPPDECVDRSRLEQGVDLPIRRRIDVRIHPDRATGGASSEAVMEGWIRLADGTEPSTMSLPLFTDAFPPSLFPRFGRIGWVPTVELTVHVRRRPVPGWIRARLECDDLCDGRMVESGTLWDASGAVVARSRQLGLLLVDPS